jgi:hypothetical protein
MLHPRLAQLGKAAQIAFVTTDPEPELKRWTTTFGAGPFFLIENLRFNYTKYRGASSDITIDAYLANWGDMQVEVIRPHDDAPSVYTEWLQVGGTGVHHLAMRVDDLETARRTIEAAGLDVTQESAAYNGKPFFYVQMGDIYLEIIQPDAGMRALFDMIRDAHLSWDGKDPIRKAPSDEVNRGAALRK